MVLMQRLNRQIQVPEHDIEHMIAMGYSVVQTNANIEKGENTETEEELKKIESPPKMGGKKKTAE